MFQFFVYTKTLNGGILPFKGDKVTQPCKYFLNHNSKLLDHVSHNFLSTSTLHWQTQATN